MGGFWKTPNDTSLYIITHSLLLYVKLLIAGVRRAMRLSYCKKTTHYELPKDMHFTDQSESLEEGDTVLNKKESSIEQKANGWKLGKQRLVHQPGFPAFIGLL